MRDRSTKGPVKPARKSRRQDTDLRVRSLADLGRMFDDLYSQLDLQLTRMGQLQLQFDALRSKIRRLYRRIVRALTYARVSCHRLARKPPNQLQQRSMPRSFLDSSGIAKKIVEYRPLTVIFSQGDPSDTVIYIQKGAVRLSVLSHAGKEAIVGMLGPGDFLGEGALAGQRVRIGTATAVSTTTVLVVPKTQHDSAAARRAGVFEPVHRVHAVAQHPHRRGPRRPAVQFERKAARADAAAAGALRHGGSSPRRSLPKLSQETLAEMVGTTRSRVNFFMNKFRKLGFIEYNGGLKINTALLSVVLHD